MLTTIFLSLSFIFLQHTQPLQPKQPHAPDLHQLQRLHRAPTIPISSPVGERLQSLRPDKGCCTLSLLHSSRFYAVLAHCRLTSSSPPEDTRHQLAPPCLRDLM
ncbi:hypothetical protein B0T17DRAFT_236565 [Bombardia bombarda]|uniref:Secreted protein n=1 Tax=Bombardia bombarda TaxID=252184 RepID=A0AA40CAC7_9PEZI|nr:hypothetical protein B0T17DRAFT_236565 [Bombardia bombarda]